MIRARKLSKGNEKKKILTLIFVSAFCLAFNFLLVFLASRESQWVEMFYSRFFYRGISGFLNTISHPFPFSLDEIFIGIEIILLVYWIVKGLVFIIGKKISMGIYYLTKGLLIISINILLFQLFWGLNNYRMTVEDLFELDVHAISQDELGDVYDFLVVRGNKLANQLTEIDEWTEEKVRREAYLGYVSLGDTYDFISPKKVKVKPLLISSFFTKSGYTGIYIPYFSEANINIEPPILSLGFTASHEIAHQKGFAGEDEANFIGFLAAMENSTYFQYSAILQMQVYIGNSLYKTDQVAYKNIADLRNEKVLRDLKERRDFWDTHINESAAETHNKLNDVFLKANNQPEGIVNYSKVTELIVFAYEKGLVK